MSPVHTCIRQSDSHLVKKWSVEPQGVDNVEDCPITEEDHEPQVDYLQPLAFGNEAVRTFRSV